MGENFLKRRNRRFFQQRDRNFEAQTARDLFSVCAPETVVEVQAQRVADHGQGNAEVRKGDEVWCSVGADGGEITFYGVGASPIAFVDGAAADHLREAHCDEQIVGRIEDLDADDVTIRLGVNREQ